MIWKNLILLPHLAPPWVSLNTLLALVTTLHHSSAVISKGNLPLEIQNCYNHYTRYSLRDVVGQSVCWACEAPAISRLWTDFQPSETPEAVKYVQSLMKKLEDHISGIRIKRQATRRCVRKEYRMLTDQERNAFHNALNVLKRDTSVPPNRYDVIARIHDGSVISSAHGGPNFLGWHRAYILLLEWELQTVDPSVCLPYWDSSTDNDLSNPRTSYVFSPDFLGGGGSNGPVTNGPFAGWVTPRFGPLSRNIGASGQLFSQRSIDNILSQRSTRDIIAPNALPPNDIEFQHNGVHIFVGGQMNNLVAAAHDPAFFLHHCFVDYLWERFRDQQRTVGLIDPQTDYPQDVGSPLHAPNRLMGFRNLTITAFQGYADNLTNTFEYEPSPSCNTSRPNCGSRYFRCDLRRGRCIPTRPAITSRGKRAVVITRTEPGRSTDKTANEPVITSTPQPEAELLENLENPESKWRSPTGIQNTFCIDGICDMRQWVYVAVKVVSIRSPDVTCQSYPMYNGSIWNKNDIYQLSAYVETSQYVSRGHPKSYEKCNDGNGIGQIFIQSQGLSYDGFYKESVITDQRLATSLAVGYLAVKDPKNGPVKALFRAFDSCGRICDTTFKTPGTRRYEPFSGVLDIEYVPGQPKQYSKTYGQATLDTWDYASDPNYPSFQDEDVVLAFYCDYRDEISWGNTADSSLHPLTTAVPIQPPTLGLSECRIDAVCVISYPCNITTHEELCNGKMYACEGKCGMYVQCHSKNLWKKTCPNNWSFDSWTGQCTPSRLCTNVHPDTLSVLTKNTNTSTPTAPGENTQADTLSQQRQNTHTGKNSALGQSTHIVKSLEQGQNTHKGSPLVPRHKTQTGTTSVERQNTPLRTHPAPRQNTPISTLSVSHQPTHTAKVSVPNQNTHKGTPSMQRQDNFIGSPFVPHRNTHTGSPSVPRLTTYVAKSSVPRQNTHTAPLSITRQNMHRGKFSVTGQNMQIGKVSKQRQTAKTGTSSRKITHIASPSAPRKNKHIGRPSVSRQILPTHIPFSPRPNIPLQPQSVGSWWSNFMVYAVTAIMDAFF